MYLYGHSDRPTILDGAMGTELIARGFDPSKGSAESWSVEHADEVRAIHAAYADAGAEVLQTNTFGALAPRLAKWNQANQVEFLIARAVGVAHEASPDLPVIGSLGPLALDLGEAELDATYSRSGAALVAAGVDGIHLETQCNVVELTCAVMALRRVASGMPLVASVTAMIGSSGFETPTGVPLDRMVAALRKLIEAGQLDAVGVNCSLDAERIGPVVERLAELGLPVWVRPQARSSQKCASGPSSETAEIFAQRAAALATLGARAIGGCCGVGPEFIRALRNTVVGAQSATPLQLVQTEVDS